jgi:hypothetical protein
MIPYFAMTDVTHALFFSIGITVVILLAFGFTKNYITVKTQDEEIWHLLGCTNIGGRGLGSWNELWNR